MAIAYSYWRRIKDGARNFDSVKGDKAKADVITLAKLDVANQVITIDEYANLIGEDYSA
jgi:hypothetical protein